MSESSAFVVTSGRIGTAPPSATHWAAEFWDGSGWQRLQSAEPVRGRHARFWSIDDPPTPQRIGEEWGSGTFRIFWTGKDKRARWGSDGTATRDEPFVLIDPGSVQAQDLMSQILGPYADALGRGNAPAVVQQIEDSPMALFLSMYGLINIGAERQVAAIRQDAQNNLRHLELQHELALERERTFRETSVKQLQLFYEELREARERESPAVRALQEQLAELMLEEVDDEADDATAAGIVKHVMTALTPVIAKVADKYLTKREEQRSAPDRLPQRDDE